MADKKQTSQKVDTIKKTNLVKTPNKEVKKIKNTQPQKSKDNKKVAKTVTSSPAQQKQKSVVAKGSKKVDNKEVANVKQSNVATQTEQATQQKPLYYDPATGQPVYSMQQNPAGASMMNMAMYSAYSSPDAEKTREERKKKEQKTFGITAIILALCGLAVFGLGWLFMSFVFNVNSVDPSFWFLIIIGWILGPFMIIVIPPILWFIGLIFGIVGAFKGPKRVVSWIGLVIAILAVVAGGFLVVTFGGGAFTA